MDAKQVYDLDFKKQCQEYDEIRNQSASTLAAVKIAKEWQLCDAERGGCRAFMGFFIGGTIVLIGVLYLLNRGPGLLMRWQENREMQDASNFMYARSGGGTFRDKLA